MKRAISAVVVVATFLLSGSLAGVAPPEIRGVVCEGVPCRPLPGLRVALYRDGDLLIDSTYTRDDGSYRFRTPPAKGRFYVIATKGEEAKRGDFFFDPSSGKIIKVLTPNPTHQVNKDLALTFASKSALQRAFRWTYDRLGVELLAVAGALCGFFYRQLVEERLMAKIQLKNFMGKLHSSVCEALDKFPKSEVVVDRDKARKLGDVVAAVSSLTKFISDHSGEVEGALAKLGQAKNFLALKNRLSATENDLRNAEMGAATPMARAISAADQELQDIRDNPLQVRTLWNRVIESIYRPSPRSGPSSGGS